MLRTLSVKNYAIIEELDVAFEPGLNIMTGETGAGKSILIDALGLLLGERASQDVVRRGSDKCVVEGVFEHIKAKKIAMMLKAGGLEQAHDLILRREVSAKGQGRCFVNDSPVTLAFLKDLGDHLVDLHGQHEHQSLLRPETHIELLDDFGSLRGLLEDYQRSYQTLSALFDQRDSLRRKEEHLRERRDLYEFQIREIDALDPHAGEDETLEEELRILENAEKLFEQTTSLYAMLYEGEQSVYDLLVRARNQLEDLGSIDRSFEESTRECSSAVAMIGEITKFIQAYNSKIEFNPERLEEIRDRLGQLSLLKKKYGGSVEAILAHRARIGEEFALAENFEEEIRALEADITREREACSHAAQRLSSKRRELAGRISRAVIAELSTLGIPHAQFEASISNRILSNQDGQDRVYVRLGKEDYWADARGYDRVEFYLSTNLGEDPRPLARVASGGEISRIMLALKSVLAKSERLPLLVFDEIDVGVSGRIAQAVGKSLKSLSRFHQILAITHLPQIAGVADAHFAVEKVEQRDRTSTRIRVLSLQERVEEVAKLMSGAEVTEAGLVGARELMGLSEHGT
jgi:DNA repair protein RecN (Recombination protein N)